MAGSCQVKVYLSSLRYVCPVRGMSVKSEVCLSSQRYVCQVRGMSVKSDVYICLSIQRYVRESVLILDLYVLLNLLICWAQNAGNHIFGTGRGKPVDPHKAKNFKLMNIAVK